MWFIYYEFGYNERNYLSSSEVNVFMPPYRLFVSLLLAYKEAEAHFEHFPLPDFLGGRRRAREKCAVLLGGLGRLAALYLRAVGAKPGSLGC